MLKIYRFTSKVQIETLIYFNAKLEVYASEQIGFYFLIGKLAGKRNKHFH